MQKKYRFLLFAITFIFLFCYGKTFGQRLRNDSSNLLTQKYQQLEPSQLLYVVTDKNIYVTGETMWLAAYLLDRWSTPDSLMPNMLYVALREEGSPLPVMKKSFLINAGVSPGSWYLPDTLHPGNYELFCTTNIIAKDSLLQHEFRTKIKIGLSHNPDFITKLNLLELKSGQDSLFVEALVTKGDKETITEQSIIRYFLGKHYMGKLNLKGGKGVIALPKSAIEKFGYSLSTTTILNKESKDVTIQLSRVASADSFQIKFYPEGGDLISGLESRIGFEVTYKGMPIAQRMILFCNGKAIDTITSGKNGMGIFSYKSKVSDTCFVRVLDKNKKLLLVNYPLPQPLNVDL